jgi:hypothetical protein
MSRRLPLVFLAAFLIVGALGCCANDSGQQKDSENPYPSDGEEEKAVEDEKVIEGPIARRDGPDGDCGEVKVDLEGGNPRTLSGTLRYTPIPPTKSMEAYMGVEFVIEDGADKHVVSETAKVSRETLEGLADKKVEAKGVFAKGAKPCPYESYPTGMNGEPLERPGRYHLISISEH